MMLYVVVNNGVLRGRLLFSSGPPPADSDYDDAHDMTSEGKGQNRELNKLIGIKR